jgi:tRNA threonylcarbamoyladenosine biosynthesis protein TsaE
MFMVTNISHSPAETFELGREWGRSAPPGLVIALCGDLGAGKTQLVKGLAVGLGIQSRILSPTFALVNVHAGGRLPLFHLDLYRLDTPEQVLAAGLEEYLYPKGVTVIEWAERWFGIRPCKPQPGAADLSNSQVSSPRAQVIRWVEIEVTSQSERSISYEDIGT